MRKLNQFQKSTQQKLSGFAGQCLVLLLIATAFTPSSLADYDVPSYDDGLNKMARRDFDGAILEFNRAVGYNSRNAKAYFKRGQCFYYLGNFQLAIDDFAAAISKDPDNSELYLWRGATYSKMGDNPRSTIDYVQALRMDPKLLKAAAGAKPAEETGVNSPMFQHKKVSGAVPNEQSVQNYLEAVRIVNENIMPVFVSGTVFSGIIRPEYPADATAPYLRPDGLAEITATPKEVIDSCRKQLELNPRDPAQHFKRGLAFEQLGKANKAFEDFEEAIGQANDPRYFLARAFLHHMSHEEASSIDDISKAHSVDPTVPALIKWK